MISCSTRSVLSVSPGSDRLGVCPYYPAVTRPAERNSAPQFVDTGMDTLDPVLADIRKLREGRGLTAVRLKERGALMSSLGTSDPQEALERFTTAIQQMEDTPWARALRVDLGHD